MEAKPLTLNRDETMILTDRTYNGDQGTQDMQVAAYRLLIKLGSLYMELVSPSAGATAEGTIVVTEAEAWLLRGKVNSGEKMASDQFFGMNLLRKLYTIVLAFDADTDGLAVAEEAGPGMGAREREALTLWQKKETDDDDKQPV